MTASTAKDVTILVYPSINNRRTNSNTDELASTLRLSHEAPHYKATSTPRHTPQTEKRSSANQRRCLVARSTHQAIIVCWRSSCSRC